MRHKLLKITGCSDAMMWYAKLVGSFVVYLGEDTDVRGPIYWSREPAGYKNIIFQCDAELIEDEGV